MYITLDEARQHLNLDDYFHEDDDYIIQLIEVSECVTAKRNNAPLSWSVDKATGELDASVRHQVLLLIGTYYNQRESVTIQNVKELPQGFEYLADLNRRYTI